MEAATPANLQARLASLATSISTADTFRYNGYEFASAEDVGIAMGTVAAHEAGHLVGLQHVDALQPVQDLMGQFYSYGVLLDPVHFGTFDLYESPSSVFGFDIDNGFDVFGKQNAPALLTTTLGNALPATTGVEVLGTAPVAGGPMVTQNANITIDFNEAMDFASLNGATVTLVGSASGSHSAAFYSSSTTRLTVDPTLSFSAGETVTVTISRNVRALDGDRMASDYAFTFDILGATPTPITVGGSLAQSTTWTSGNVYYVTSNLTIPAGISLIIEPGTVVKFASNKVLQSDGLLDVQSTPSSRVVFTSWRDDEYGGDSNGDGPTSGGRGDWGWLSLRNSGITLEDCLIRYAGGSNGYYAVSADAGADPVIRNNVIEETLAASSNRPDPWSDAMATGFQRLYAYSANDGSDAAELTGSASGGNRYYGYPTYSTLTDAAGSFYHYARGFQSVKATGSVTNSTTDRAYLHDSAGNDTLYGRGNQCYVEDTSKTVYHNEVWYFDYIYARSTDNDAVTDDTVDVADLAYMLMRMGTW